MADWIKIEADTAGKPEVRRIARLLNLDRDTVLGKLLRVWGWFDRNSVDGTVDGVVSADVDDIVDAHGFADAMRAVGWLAQSANGDGLTLPNFERHNGQSAKKRALKAERQARWRGKKIDASVDAPVDTTPYPREDKIREDINTSKSHSLTRKPRAPDERSNHPAIKAIRDVTRKFPDKAIWDEIITRVGSDPDSALLTECYSSWIKHGFNPTNYAWLFEWYLSGGPQDYGNRQSASDRNFEARVISERLLAKPRGS